MWLEWKLRGLGRSHWEEGTWGSEGGGSRESQEGGSSLPYAEERLSGMRNEKLTLKLAGSWSFMILLPTIALELGTGSGANRSWGAFTSLLTSLSLKEGKTKTNGIFRRKQGQEKIISCVQFTFTCFRVKPSSHTFVESPLLVSNLMLLNTGRNLKSEEKESAEKDKKKEGINRVGSQRNTVLGKWWVFSEDSSNELYFLCRE